METQILEELGVSNAEAKIYLTLLELGSSKTGKIIDKTKLQSSTVYHLLGALIEKGLVSYIHKGKIKFFQAESPEIFLTKLEDKKNKFQEILPQLKQKEESLKNKLGAQIFEGFNGLNAVFEDIIQTMKKGDTYYFFSSPSENIKSKIWDNIFRSFHLKRSKKGINVKGLSTPANKQVLKDLFNDVKHTQIGFIDEFAPTGIIIYANKIVTWEWQEKPIAVVIESKTIARSYKDFFEKMWKIAKK